MRANPAANVRVFVIWEPVLPTDWRRPGESQTSFVPDQRATHFWDLHRDLSAMYGGPANRDALAGKREISFGMKRAVWDAALVYPPGAGWGQPAQFLLAPVVSHRDQLAASLR